jgi:hypothetical protein
VLDEGLKASLDVLYGGLGKGKLQFLIKKIFKKISAENVFQFLNFWSTKPWIRIGILPKMLDPDPKYCFED